MLVSYFTKPDKTQRFIYCYRNYHMACFLILYIFAVKGKSTEEQ